MRSDAGRGKSTLIQGCMVMHDVVNQLLMQCIVMQGVVTSTLIGMHSDAGSGKSTLMLDFKKHTK